MLDTTTITITSSKMAKNYSHCPLKKRPVLQEFNVKEDIIPTPPPQIIENDIADEPENLSTKPEDLSRRTGADSTYPKVCSPPQAAAPVTPIATVPTIPRLGGAFHRVAPLSPEPIHYAPTTWHISVAPTINTTQAPHYPPAYFPMGYPYSPAAESYHHRYPLYPSPPARYAPRDNSCSPPQIHNQRTPLASLALIPEPRRCGPLDRASLSPASSGAASVRSHSPTSSNEPADLSSPPTLPINESRRITSARHQCPDCGKSYSTFSGLSKHRQFHCAAGDGPRKSFSCKYCDKVYVSLGALKMHIRTHTLPCRCTMCGKAFSRPWLLQGHIRTHTGEKPFSCQYCHRAFADRSNLRAHLQTHSDVKKYSCQTCNKMFSRMSLLTKHAEGGCSGGNNGAQIYAVPQQEQQIY